MDGVLIIDKPVGPTSHDVVQTVKRALSAAKVGHLGTLDPDASGVLPMCVDGATCYAQVLAGAEKRYQFSLVLGKSTTTDDAVGETLAEHPTPIELQSRLKELLPQFIGQILQRPPAYAAVKVGGKPLYWWARKGKPVMIEPRVVDISDLRILGVSAWPRVEMEVACRSGTYVRSLCRDIGAALGCGGHAGGIRRLLSGRFDITDAIDLDRFLALSADERMQRVIPLAKLLSAC